MIRDSSEEGQSPLLAESSILWDFVKVYVSDDSRSLRGRFRCLGYIFMNLVSCLQFFVQTLKFSKDGLSQCWNRPL